MLLLFYQFYSTSKNLWAIQKPVLHTFTEYNKQYSNNRKVNTGR